jgi:hypothetical protein
MVETDQKAAAVRCCAEEASKYEKESLEALAFLGSEVVRTGMKVQMLGRLRLVSGTRERVRF